MKNKRENTIKHSGHPGLLVFLAAALVGAVGCGLHAGYNKLHDLWLERCVLKNPSEQVFVTSGKMVKPDVLIENFGLRKGANLALIDFNAKREEILKKIPNLRAITVSLHLPNRVRIIAEERIPVARMSVCGRQAETGRVVDTEGVVFMWQRGTHMLPIIREKRSPGTGVGQRLTGRALAALRLIESSQETGRADLGVLEVSTDKQDYLLVTLGNYSRAWVAWEGMDDPTPAACPKLDKKLTHLAQVIRSQTRGNTPLWIATDTTDPGYIYASDEKKGAL